MHDVGVLTRWLQSHEWPGRRVDGSTKLFERNARRQMAGHGTDASLDPICGLPLNEDTAEEIAHAPRGEVVLFCSVGCLDTWRRRPARTGTV